MIIYLLLGVCIVLLTVNIVINIKNNGNDVDIRKENSNLLNNVTTTMNTSFQSMGEVFSSSQREIGKLQSDKLEAMERRFSELDRNNRESLEAMRKTLEERVRTLSEDNAKQLDGIRHVVDEKLQKTIDARMSESFKLVNERLAQVYEGLGEMKTLASGVGDLKKVLSNVKTRGILGEIQLGAILEEILSIEQYEANCRVIPTSNNVVEFAIKLPADDGKCIYMPIDSKFPADSYSSLLDAYDEGDPERVKSAKAELVARIKSFAKDINTKYIEAPYTTDFAIMFLPFEGLYAEAVNLGLVEDLQRQYKVNICGPSTMAAYLNSLQMGFKTLALQKRSAEVWEILGAVKTEFDKFAGVLTKTQSKLDAINNDLNTLVGTRTRAIIRKLKDVERLDSDTSQKLLGPEFDFDDE